MQQTVSVPSPQSCEAMINVFRDLYPHKSVFAFRGALGAGKTTLIKALCRDLGVDGEMSSPSFALVNAYESTLGEVFHMDLYRLKDPGELVEMGWYDYLSQGKLMFVEWPERAGDQLPDDAVDVLISADPDTDHRTLTLTYSL